MARVTITARSTLDSDRPQSLGPTSSQRVTRRTRSHSEAPVNITNLSTPKRATRFQSRQASVDAEHGVGESPRRNNRRNARQQPTRRKSNLQSDILDTVTGLQSHMEERDETPQSAMSFQLNRYLELGTVQESPDLEAEPLTDILDDAEDHLDTENSPRNDVIRSGSVASYKTSISNRTSASQVELEQMDPDEIIEFLPDLYNNAAQLLRFLLPPGSSPESLQQTVQQLSDMQSKQRKRFDKRDRALTSTQESFGQRTYLRLDLILRSLLNVDSVSGLPDRPWRPDDLIYIANLAMAMKQMVLSSPDNAQLYDVLFALDAAFPTPFLSGFDKHGVGTSEFLRETCELALELRTQVAVMALISPAAQESPDPTQIVRAIFYDEDDLEEPTNDSQLMVRGWTGLPPPYEVHTHDGIFTDTIVQRVDDLANTFVQAESLESALRTLQQQFPWEAFRFMFMVWAEQRTNEISDEIATRGSLEQIVNALEYRRINGELEGEVVIEPTEAPVEEPTLEPTSSKIVLAPTSTGPKSFGSKRGIAALKARQQKLASSAPTIGAPKVTPVPPSEQQFPSTAFIAQFVQPVDEDVHDDEIEEIHEPEAPQSPRKTQVERFRQQAMAQAKENKENLQQRSLLDPQPGATRVEWQEDEDSQKVPVRQRGGFRLPRHLQPTSQATTQQKRPREDDIDDPSEDEGFQNDTRNMAPPVRNAAPPRQLVQHPRSPLMQRSPSASQSPPKRQRRNPGQAIDLYEPPSRHGSEQAPGGYDYPLVSQLAKIKSQRMAQRRAPRERKAWTPAETNQLIHLIGETGCSWSRLKQMDEATPENILWHRKPEDLRFKARNMKVDFLKAGVPPPPNFEDIQLGKKELDQLERVGVFYEQVAVRARPAILQFDDEEEE